MKEKKKHKEEKSHHSSLRLRHIRVGILTCSTSRFEESQDRSGLAIKEFLGNSLKDCKIAEYKIVKDGQKQIAGVLKDWCDKKKLDLILTTGGTGFSPSDVTPEATKSVLDKETPGLAEAMRMFSRQSSTVNYQSLIPFLSRGVCGIRRKTLIVNLPGAPKGAQEFLKVIAQLVPHALGLIHSK